MKVLSIKNFALYQHYKDRRPPWVKLHAAVLDDYAFECLQDASKAHLMLLWVLASQCDNKIPYDIAWISRKIGAKEVVDVEELVAHGFIEVSDDASKMLAPRKQKAIAETEREAEAETEAETEEKTPRRTTRGGSPSGFALAPYLDVHREFFPDSDPPAGRYARTFKRLEAKHGAVLTLQRWRNCLARKATFATPEELAAHWPEYAEGGGPRDPLEVRVASMQAEDEEREKADREWIERRMAASGR